MQPSERYTAEFTQLKVYSFLVLFVAVTSAFDLFLRKFKIIRVVVRQMQL